MKELLLKLLGLDLSKPFESLVKLLLLLNQQKLVDELHKALCINMSLARKKEVAAKLLDASNALNNNDCLAFATALVDVLKGIKV